MGHTPDQAMPRNSTGQAPDRPRTGSGQAIDPIFDGTSRPASANFSARPDSGLIRDASRAVVDVDVDAGTRLLAGGLLTKSVNQSQVIRRWLDDCARLLAGRLRTESIVAHAVARRLSGSQAGL